MLTRIQRKAKIQGEEVKKAASNQILAGTGAFQPHRSLADITTKVTNVDAQQ